MKIFGIRKNFLYIAIVVFGLALFLVALVCYAEETKDADYYLDEALEFKRNILYLKSSHAGVLAYSQIATAMYLKEITEALREQK